MMGTAVNKGDLDQMMSHGTETAQKMMKRIRGSGRRALEATHDTVQERPLMSLVVIFVLGLVFGTLLDYKLRR